jgi:hypothetical protein
LDDGGGAAYRPRPSVSDVQHVLVLIDCSASMFAPCIVNPEFPDSDDDRLTPMVYTLDICNQLLRSKIRTVTIHKTGKRDGLGILLYHTKFCSTPPSLAQLHDVFFAQGTTTPSESPFDEKDDKEDDEDDDDDDDDGLMLSRARQSTVHELLPLNPPGRAAVKLVKDCLASNDPFGEADVDLDLQADFCNDNDHELPQHPLTMALHEASRVFRQAPCVKKTTSSVVTDRTRGVRKAAPPDGRSIWIFTNDDNDSDGPDESKKILKTLVDDLRESGIEVAVWPLPKPDPQVKTESTESDDDHDPNEYSFNYDFYDAIGVQSPMRDYTTLDDMKDMVHTMTAQWKKTRRLFCGPLLLPGQIQGSLSQSPPPPGIMLDFYNLVQIATLPAKIKIHQQTGRYVSRLPRVIQSML